MRLPNESISACAMPSLYTSVDRFVPRFAQTLRQGVARAPGEITILGADHEIGSIPTVLEEWIAADGDARVGGFRLAKQVGDIAFGRPRTNRHRNDRPPALQHAGQRLEHAGRD